MMRNLWHGAVAGALGTVTLNMSTYLDMAVRGRPSSSVPASVVGTLADRAGVELAEEGKDSDTAAARRSGLGALFGYVTGITVGAAFGVLRPHAANLPAPLAGLAVGGAAMAASDLSATSLGVTDPRSWAASGWLADIVPHALYGMATAVAFDHLHRR